MACALEPRAGPELEYETLNCVKATEKEEAIF